MVGSEMQRDRSYKEELLRAAEKVKPADFVVTGSLEDVEVKALYSVSDLFCLPGSSETNAVEGFGLVFLEAAAQGLTAIAGAVGGVPEVVRDGETGVLVPPDNPKALGIALVDLLKDRERRERFGAAARAQARSFTWERCALETFGEA
jgi:phosphatidylinositol alpha-1,6-mannosyltransferase